MTPTTLQLTPAVWRATLDALEPYRRRRVEGGCLWYGRRGGGSARAVLVGIPNQVNHPRNFDIPADWLAELNGLVPDGLIVVGQVHTHPGADTTHSPWDDRMMVSRKVFSLVLPHYAAPPCDISSVGVHTHDGHGWVKLLPAEVQRRLIIETEGDAPAGAIVVDAR